MISNSSCIHLINELMEEFSQQGLNNGFSNLISKLLNELMKAEREHAVEAEPYERTEARKGYAIPKLAQKLAAASVSFAPNFPFLVDGVSMNTTVLQKKKTLESFLGYDQFLS